MLLGYHAHAHVLLMHAGYLLLLLLEMFNLLLQSELFHCKGNTSQQGLGIPRHIPFYTLVVLKIERMNLLSNGVISDGLRR